MVQIQNHFNWSWKKIFLACFKLKQLTLLMLSNRVVQKSNKPNTYMEKIFITRKLSCLAHQAYFFHSIYSPILSGFITHMKPTKRLKINKTHPYWKEMRPAICEPAHMYMALFMYIKKKKGVSLVRNLNAYQEGAAKLEFEMASNSNSRVRCPSSP